MRVLIVGAGAVGQVYGRHLSLGGAEVSFLVKPKYRVSAGAGYVMYPLNSKNPSSLVRFEDFGVFDQVEDVVAEDWDQLWLTVPADALLGDWLDKLVGGLSSKCVVVCLSPGHETNERLVDLVGRGRLVSGMINLISYQAPLNGEDRFDEPGVAYWFPPLSPSPFSGPKESVKAVCETLRRGGQPAKAHKDVQSAIDFPQAILMTHLLALEAGGWKFRGLREDNRLGSAKVAATQAMSIMAKKKGLGQAWWMMFWRPGLVGMGLRLAPFLVPLDLETYLEYHFTKVRKQTLLFVRQYIAWGQELELPTNGLSNLLDNVEA